MPRKTCFNKSWLSSGSVDSNGDILSDWCSKVKSDTFLAYCKVCSKTNMGLAQILSHVQSEKHKKKNLKTQKGQTLFEVVASASIPGLPSAASPDGASTSQSDSNVTVADVVFVDAKFGKKWTPISIDDKVKKAEILFALKLVSSNYSYNSYSDIVDVCKTAFVDSEVATYMELGRAKVSYFIAHGIAPYFLSYFLKDL